MIGILVGLRVGVHQLERVEGLEQVLLLFERDTQVAGNDVGQDRRVVDALGPRRSFAMGLSGLWISLNRQGLKSGYHI